jgi:ATP-binding cassette subfamily C protein CydD
MGHIMELGPAYARGERTGELVTTLTEGIERLDAYVAGYLPQLALTVGVPLLIVAALLPVDWISSVLLLATTPIIPLLMILVGSHAEGHLQRQWTTLSRLGANFLDAVQGLPTIVLFGREKAERDRLAEATEQFRRATLQVMRVASMSGAVLELMTSLAIGLIAVALAIRLIDGGISFQAALVVFFLTPEFYRPLRELGIHYHAGREGSAAARRITEILRLPAGRRDRGAPVPGRSLEIRLDGPSYSYPGASRPALEDIHLALLPNTCTAVVGRSGAGKSTLVDLLLGSIRPTAGAITVNGLSLSQLDRDAWRAYVALVPQRPHLFTGTIVDNIRLSKPDAGREEIERVAALAGVAGFVERLPDGYSTLLGERGARLSAGEVQRIAIARAFLKDAPFLILDEPTSSLDPESEAIIRRALAALMSGRTVLVVAHRLHTVASADQIAVLHEGRLVEVGRPETLLALQGAYAALVHAHRTAPVEVAG